MILSDTSVKRPVFATVISLLLVTFGVLSFVRLPLREYPDINPPIVTIETNYPSATADIVETRVTQLLEERVSGIEGIKTITSNSRNGQSQITVEFKLGRDIDAAANDIRDRVSRVVDNLPEEVDPPEVFKEDANNDVIVWLNLASPELNQMELTDYAQRYIVDRLSVVDGVARVRIGGRRQFAMRVWLDRVAMAARGVTANDVEQALRQENVELPGGRIESLEREFTVRIKRSYETARDFFSLVVKEGEDGHLVRLGELGRVEIGASDDRADLRGNGDSMIGLGIIRQSTANTLEVATGIRAEVEKVRKSLPEHIQLATSYDTTVFIDSAIDEVYKTLFIAMGLVVFVILVFLGNIRSALVPAITVPVSLVASFIALHALGFSVNLLTLLALVLAIGLVVDDAIVVLENIHRRVEMGEPPLLAAFRGARQVAFAVVATTLVLISVFVPISLLTGNVGRLFSEFALALAAAVGFSSLVALTLCPMMCSKLLCPHDGEGRVARWVDAVFGRLSRVYRRGLERTLRGGGWAVVVFTLIVCAIVLLFRLVPREYVPQEDRWAFFVMMIGPEGSSYEYTERQMNKLEEDVMPLVESGEAERVLTLIPRFGATSDEVNGGIVLGILKPEDQRERTTYEIMGEIGPKVARHPGMIAFPVARGGLGRGASAKPVQFVLGGADYRQLAAWRDVILEKAEQNPNLIGVDYDYKETKPQLLVEVDRNRAADLGVPLASIGRTLETMLGSRDVTTFIDDGEEYDVILEIEDEFRRTPQDLNNIYVRSTRTGELIPLGNLVNLREVADAPQLNRYNRIRAITITAGLADGYTQGEALAFFESIVEQDLNSEPMVDYKGESREYKEARGSLVFVFSLALVIVFLVLAAQFESFIHPVTIMATVPLALAGGLFGLWLLGDSLNIFSQIGMVMLIGLAAKNGVLMVEFANQLRDEGHSVRDAVLSSAEIRLRPILMTTISTAIGAVPLLLATGAGSETRVTIGIVVFFGVVLSTIITLFLVPLIYDRLGPYTSSPKALSRKLEAFEKEHAFKE